jgi:hypothetical protein
MRTGVERAGWALVIVQVVHGFTPAETEAEGYVGLVGGLILLLAAMAAVVGFRTGKRWAAPLTGWTGLAIAVGFTLYHAVPFHSPLTNPYLGEPVGAPAWISVALAVAAGGWAAYEGLVRATAAEDRLHAA